jgi:hypothetical protein
MGSANEEFERLKAYLRWRVEEWVRGGRLAKQLADKAGISEGWMSSIRSGEPIGERKLIALLDAFEISLEDALEASKEWAVTQRALGLNVPVLPDSDNLRRAIEIMGAKSIDPSVHQAATAALAQFGDREVDQWMLWLRHIREAHMAGVLAQRLANDRFVVERTKPRRPEAPAQRPRRIKKA